MKLKPILLSSLILFTMVYLSATVAFGNQERDVAFLDQYVKVQLKHGNLYQICFDMADHNKIPIGLEGGTDFNTVAAPNILREDGTLREVLDSIVKQEPNYAWEVRDGVVNLYPVRGRDEVLSKFLSFRIVAFSSSKERGGQQMRSFFENESQTATLLAENQLQLWVTSYVRGHWRNDDAPDIEMNDTDVKSILNRAVVEATTLRLWVLERPRRLKDTIYLRF